MQTIVDEELAVTHKRRARAMAVPDADFLMRRTVEDLAERLAAVDRRFAVAAAIHCWTPDAAAAVAASGKADTVERVEADAAFLPQGGKVAPLGLVPYPPESLDLAVSLLSLHEVNDVPGYLAQMRRSLRPDGLFLAAMAGAGTLAELRDCLLTAEAEIAGGASARILPFVDVRDCGALLQRAGFALPVADVETVVVRYADAFRLMADLRAMGATSTLSGRGRRVPPRALFLRAAELYAERYADADGRIRATFTTVWMSGWAPHASQQKPLAPGSAKVSLANILEDRSRRGR